MRELLKRVRNVVADATAASVDALPFTEPLFIRAGRALNHLPWLDTLYRRSRMTLAERLRKSGRQFRTLHVGELAMKTDVSEFTSHDAYFLGRLYEPETTRFLKGALKPGDVFIDIGANHGYFAVMAALLVGPSGRVHAFEPNPPVHAQLLAQIAANGVASTVVPHALALSDREGQLDLYVSIVPSNSGLSSLILHEGSVAAGNLSASSKVSVRATTFDAWASEQKIDRIDVVKIDVEGAEELVFRGMARTLAETPPRAIVCETTADGPADRLLRARGYDARPLEHAVGTWGNILYTRARGS